MEPAGSTLIDPPCAGRTGVRRPDARSPEGPFVPADDAALLLPMVRRVVRTERGPAALVSWLRRSGLPPAHQTEAVAALAEDLARLLSHPAGSPADTLAEAH